MQAIESTPEINVPKVNKIAIKRRINPGFDHKSHHIKFKRRVAEKKRLRNKIQGNKEKYQQTNKAYKTHLQNNKKENIKTKLSDPTTNNV